MKQLQLDGEIMAMENPQTRWIGHCHVWDTTLQVQTTQLGVPAMATEEHEEYTKKMFHWNRMRPTRGGPQAIRLSFLMLGMPLISFGLPFQIDFFRVFVRLVVWGVWGIPWSNGPMAREASTSVVGRLICKNHNGCPLNHRLASLAPSCLVSVIR